MWPAERNIFILLVLSFVVSEKLFDSKPVIVRTFENETVLLPCYIVKNDGQTRVRWYKGDSLLGDSLDAHHLLPARVRMHANYSLQIDQLTPEDSADYTCEIVRPEPLGSAKQTHTIEVQYPPTVRTDPDDGYQEVRKGQYVDIACYATGVPQPVIDWKKNGEPMQLLEHRARIRFKAEHRQLSGVYQCVASNGVGEAVSSSIRVVVQDAPTATAEQAWVHSAPGYRAALSARLAPTAPPPTVHWLHDGRPLAHSDRIVFNSQGDIYQLIFRTVRKSDFGNYTFRAENQLGMADVSFRLTGVPNIATFKVDRSLNKPTITSFTLIWEVDSYSAINEYNLWLRPYFGRPSSESEGFTTEQSLNKWSKIVIPGEAGDGPIHSASYTVRGLMPSTVYEAIVTSRNAFGWSKPSSILHFATEPGVFQKPSTSDYSETPILEDIEEQMFNNSQLLERSGLTDGGARGKISLYAILLTMFVTVTKLEL